MREEKDWSQEILAGDAEFVHLGSFRFTPNAGIAQR